MFDWFILARTRSSRRFVTCLMIGLFWLVLDSLVGLSVSLIGLFCLVLDNLLCLSDV